MLTRVFVDNNFFESMFKSNSIESIRNKYPLYHTLKKHCEEIKQKKEKFKNFIIYGEGGTGKSFEMKITVLKFQHDAQNQKDSIQCYYYDLRDYLVFSDIQKPSNPSEPFYIFLDGYDELTSENQRNLAKEIRRTQANSHSTFFIIATRKENFEGIFEFPFKEGTVVEKYILETNYVHDIFNSTQLYLQKAFFRKHKDEVDKNNWNNSFTFIQEFIKNEKRRIERKQTTKRSTNKKN